MKFSIIIPARFINDFLRESITELKKLQYMDYEVLLILDNAETYEFGDAKFAVIASGPASPGEKRNIGAKKASGDILVFLDDDAFPAPNWLNEAALIFENPQVYALGGPAVTPPSAPFLERMSGRILESWAASGNTVYRHSPRSQRYISDYPTVNLFVRKDAFWAIGGFSKDFWPGEDTKLCLDLVSHFKRPFLYSPLPLVFHHRRKLLIPYMQQISRYGRYRGRFARDFPATSRLPMYFAPSAFVLTLILGLLLSFVHQVFFLAYEFVVLTYASLLLVEGRKVFLKDDNPLSYPVYMLGTFLTHVWYGANFAIGFVKRPELKLKAVDTKTGNYSEG